ncbi:MAG: restriction endonuclease subunit S [Firmicutes bacterium]|nr:restriction endonuclease subunit S [Bacillota bacterium]
MNLSDINWQTFKVKELFTIEKCKCSKVADLKSGNVPYVGATNRNNGVIKFIKYDEKLITKGNCIAFICDGDGSVGYSIYKSEDFIGSTTVKVGRNKKLNKYNAQFIVGALDKNRSIYSYGYKRNEPRLKNETILLPANKDGEADFDLMEEIVKNIRHNKILEYNNYAESSYGNLEYKEVPLLNNKEWREFFLVDIFDSIQRGKRLTKENQEDGKKPYVSSSALNNGVDNFISNDKKVRIFKNCLSLANSGSVGSCFYEPFEFVASDHVTHLSKENADKYIYLFMVTMINRLTEKYNFNREINDTRIKREKILLPVTADDKPDYDYMSQYIKNIIINNRKKEKGKS